MLKLISIFLMLTTIIAGTLKVLQHMSWLERWKTAKVLAFAAVCGIICTALLTTIVILF